MYQYMILQILIFHLYQKFHDLLINLDLNLLQVTKVYHFNLKVYQILRFKNISLILLFIKTLIYY